MSTSNSWNNQIAAANSAITLNSGTNAVSVSTDASATTCNLCTGAASKVVTLGSTNTTSSLSLQYGTADFTLASATGTIMSALDTGEITYPLQPAFLGTLNSNDTNVTGNGATYYLGTNVAFTEVFDQNGDFNTNGTFTAPITGRYSLTCKTKLTGCTACTLARTQIVTSNRNFSFWLARAASSENYDIFISVISDMDTGDTATFGIYATGDGADNQDLDGNTQVVYVCGYLVC